jgi:hypothetical protein
MNRFLAAALLIGCTVATTATLAVTPKAARKPPVAKVEPSLPPAEGEQNAAAAMVHFGDYACEFNQSVQVSMNPKYDGYIDVSFGKQKFTMKPVLSSTGALRLEDVKGQTMMLQIAYKSMLMDVKVGRRLVDECVHEKQLVAKKAAEGQPTAASMFSADPGQTAPAGAAAQR